MKTCRDLLTFKLPKAASTPLVFTSRDRIMRVVANPAFSLDAILQQRDVKRSLGLVLDT